MKLCPKCSTKNSDSASFCQGCGNSLQDVEPTREDMSQVAGELWGKANRLLGEGAQKAKEAMAAGVEKTKEAVEAGKEKIQSAPTPPKMPTSYTPAKYPQQKTGQSANGSNGGWDNAVNPSDAASVTVKRYPFFKDEDENTVAVIGEDAVMSDIEGLYTKPYAVLTQQRLYCKNEAGNFITEISEMQMLRQTKLKVLACFYWRFYLALSILATLTVKSLLLILLMLASIYFGKFRYKKDSQNLIIAQILLFVGAIWGTRVAFLNQETIGTIIALCSAFFGIFYTFLIYWMVKKPDIFSIRCTGGTFTFLVENYPKQEFSDFRAQAAKICPAKLSNGSYKPNGTTSHGTSNVGKQILTVIGVVATLIAIVCFAWYSLTHCKASDCSSEVYKDGYCKYHYSLNKVDNAAHDAFDSANSLWDDLFGN